ncbi:MAG: bis(5'-nucleosyl)-tetraphosphatase (symmetrical) YqeK [Firmicutes bacterium]|nr:bis(5'-nucleosyl)-tetraphosphatase (symmetrical) YqeK [Bacillota bacterium]
MLSCDEIRALLSKRLSKERYAHSLRVAATARELAERHGVQAEAAERAGLWHDAYKELPVPEQIARAREKGILTPEYEAHPHLLHGPLAAACLPEDFGETDAEVLQAVRLHTTGDAGMSRLDMVVYLADLLEPEHDFPGAARLRAAARVSLEGAMLAALEHTLQYLLQRGAWIDPKALRARNALLPFRIKE